MDLTRSQGVKKLKNCIYLMIVVFYLMLTGCNDGRVTHVVPMVALLANPGEYDGQVVSVVGFLGRGGDLYLSEERSRINDRDSALLINFTKNDREIIEKSQCTKSHVEIIGNFGLVDIKGLAPRVGITSVRSVRHQLNKRECLDISKSS